MPVIFVHGITIRQKAFEDLCKKVQAGITNTENRPDLSVNGFYWGDMASSLRYGGASIPGFLEGTRAITIDQIPMDGKGLKALLLDEPYLELVALRDTEKDFGPAGVGFREIPKNVETRNETLARKQPAVVDKMQKDPKLLLSSIGSVVQRDNKIKVVVQKAFDQAVRTDRKLGVVDLIDPLTRCLTAGFYKLYEEAGGEEVMGQFDSMDTRFAWNDVENQVQSIIEQELGGQRGWIGNKIKNLALASLTVALRRDLRRRVMDNYSLFIGDVLAYLVQRDSILKKLEDTVASSVQVDSSPLWLIGHSLGGIICYDYCCETSRKVERLATVGSQVGLFGEYGVLKNNLTPSENLIQTPASVVKWLNIYDPDDMLSFLSHPVFDRVVDIEFDTKAPFPISHGEYWNMPELYRKLTE